MQSVNVVLVTGNLTRDPELREAGSSSVCSMRVAVNGRKKDSTGDWVDDPSYFNVSVWGKQGENCAQYLSKGKAILVQGRLKWREWTTDQGTHREAVDIVADNVQFLSPKDGDGGSRRSTESDVPADPPESASSSGSSSSRHDDDIPF